MCGFAGLVNVKNLDVESVKNSLVHREQQSTYKYRNTTLIHTRLSIQDLENGIQPFIIGNYVLVFNGEIYNHIELRKLITNYSFKTFSDTETFLALFIKYGENFLERVDGMFAFAILDKKRMQITLGRDRAGKKPLYLFNDNSTLFFSSELNTMKVINPDLINDNDAISSFLRNGFFGIGSTPYKKVESLMPGMIYKINLLNLKISKLKYFDYQKFFLGNKIEDLTEGLYCVESALHKSIKNRLKSSDIEVGAFLSGGIDSSLIVAIASQYVKKLKTFTVKFAGNYDESSLANVTAKRYSTCHKQIEISMKLSNDVEDILKRYGEPFMDSSAIPSYYVSREAKKYVSVVLNGDGADELFGGYRRYVPIANNWISIISRFYFLSNFLPKAKSKFSKYSYFERLLSASNKSGLSFYNSMTNDIFEDYYHFGENNIFSDFDQQINNIDNTKISNFSKFLIKDFNFILNNDLLKKMDIATMSNSLEARSPFLSKYLLELAPTISDNLKIRGFQTKFILRELAKNYSLFHIAKQPKRGFEVPLVSWVEGELKQNIYDRINKNGYFTNYIDWYFVDQILNDKVAINKYKRAKILWTLYCLEVWKSSQ